MLNCNFWAVLVSAGLMTLIRSQAAQAVPTAQTITGEITAISVASKTNVWSRGVISVGGMNVVIPANLVIQMPVERFTIAELFTKAPDACVAAGQTGLARGDSCFPGLRGAIATILANRQDSGEVIAGMVKIEKAPEALMGVVTYINHDDGYFRVNGLPNSATTGSMVRINDPISRHTIQKGLGCSGTTANCSPDIRFPVDNENYTVTFTTGVPICIPSTVKTGSAERIAAFAAAASNVAPKLTQTNALTGEGDPLCPKWARQLDPIIDVVPTEFAFNLVPIVLGDSLDALGSFETVGGVKFFSAHTVTVHSRIMTQEGYPDYMKFDLVEWDMAGYTNQRARLRLIGFTSLTDSQLDIYALHTDQKNVATEFPLATTVGNPLTINLGAPPFGGSIFKIIFDVDFVAGVKPKGSPCANLANGGFLGGDVAGTGGCIGGATSDLAQNFGVLAPVTRDIIAHTRNQFKYKIPPSKDILGRATPNGQYLNPVEIAPPDPLETNVNGVKSSFLFTGVPWLLDRRLGPTGCKQASDCTNGSYRLDPWPWDGGVNPGKDPQNPPTASVPAAGVDEIISYVSGTPPQFRGLKLTLPTAASTATTVVATPPRVAKQCTVVP